MSSGPSGQSNPCESEPSRNHILEEENRNICELCESLIQEIEKPNPQQLHRQLRAPERLRRNASMPDCALCTRFLHLVTAYVQGEVSHDDYDGMDRLSWENYTNGIRDSSLDIDQSSDGEAFYIIPEVDEGIAKARANRASKETGEEDELSLANIWLSRCLSEHERCTSNRQPQQYPTRLLEIRENVIYLIDCLKSQPHGPYATLSHCWGKRRFRLLTKDNLEQFYAGVPITKFLPTFRHAILTAHKLGIRYLWIDCYCIIQSDNADLRHELTHMSEVYSNAIVNIGIGYASSPFEERRYQHSEPPGIQLRPKASLEARSYLAIESEGIGEDVGEFELRNTTFDRAWCLQERLLCPRMLHFTASTVFWECEELRLASETIPQGYTPACLYEYFRRPFALPQMVESEGTSESQVQSYERLWAEIVESYSSLELSRPDEDKFNALGGVAKLMAELVDDEYCAGFFRRSLISQLLWTPSSPDPRGLMPCVWRAPSWSWASFDGLVFPHTNSGGTTAKLMDVDLVLADPSNKFGSLLGASLTIQGWMIDVTLGTDIEHQERLSIICRWGPHALRIHFDHLQSPSTFALFLTNFKQPNKTSQQKSLLSYVEDSLGSAEKRPFYGSGLVLERIDNGLFKRVGVFKEEALKNETYTEFMNGLQEVTIV